MRNLVSDTGCVFDTLIFLARYYDEMINEKPTYSIENEHYASMKRRIAQNGISLPRYLYPLVRQNAEARSLLYYAFFEGNAYNECTYR